MDSGDGSKKACIRWGGPGPHAQEQFLGKVIWPGMPDTLCRELCKWFDQSFGLWNRVGPKKHVVDGVHIPHAKEQFLRERTYRGVPDDSL